MTKGVIVVVGSRAGSGSVDVGDGVRTNRSRRDTSKADASRRSSSRDTSSVDGSEPSTIGAGTLNVQKARILLMLQLTKTSDPPEVAKVFRVNQ